MVPTAFATNPVREVTFSIDMSVQIAAGKFNPDTMTMEVRGQFNNWADGLSLIREGSSGIYSGTFSVPGAVGETTSYAFLSIDGPYLITEALNTRYFTLGPADEPMILPTVYFNNQPPPVTVLVTFRVDMTAQMDVGRYNPNTMGMEVRGDFNGWSEDSGLAREGTSGIYSGTFTVSAEPGTEMEYSFYGTGDPFRLGLESFIPRSFVLEPGGDPVILPTVYFGDIPPPPRIDVTFSIDMGVLIAAGNFDPETMGVEVRGNFNSRGGTSVLARAGSTAIYSGTFAIAVNSWAAAEINYLFHVTGHGGLGAESIPSRVFILAPNDDPVILPTVFFNNLAPAVTVDVTFSVDLSVQIAAGAFQPDTMGVEVRGSFNNWAGGLALVRIAPTSSVYSGTFSVSNNQGATITYTFHGTGAGGLGSETNGNRSFLLGPDGVPQVLPTVYFNNQLPPVPVDVTFSVDMGYYVEAGEFNPTSACVKIYDYFAGWNNGSNLVRQGESAIYSGTLSILVDANEGKEIHYKFTADCGSGLGVENISLRTRLLRPEDHPLVLPTVYYGNQPPLPKVPVKFSVNMSAQMALGNFNFATMGVEVDIYNYYNGTPRWAGALAREGGSDIYSGTFIVPGNADATRQYRFRITRTNDVVEESFYRLYDLGPAGATQTLPIVYFDNVGPEVTVDVTFAVDLGVQISAGAFNPLTMGVEVRGGFNTWAGGATLARVSNSSIYAGTFAVTGWSGGAQEYIFNGTGAGGLGLETIDNRSLALGPAGTPQVLPSVLFNDQKPPPSRNVSFSVNMSVQMAAGVFNPGTMSVAVGGDFNGWSSRMVLSRAGTTSNYSGTFSVSGIEGWEQGYRFRILDGSSIIEETVPQFPRFFDLDSPGSTQDMPIVFFNNQSQPFSVAHVTFSVDMRAQMMSGAFDPSTMGVEVFGTFNSWNRGRVLTRAGTNSIYSGTFAVPGIEGAEVQFLYLFSGNPDVVELVLQPARSFELGSAGTTQVLSTVYFDNQSPPDPPPPGITAFRMVTGQLVFDIPAGYALQSVYGADTALVNGAWVWTLLQPGVHYTVNNGSVTIISQGRKVIRIGLVQN